VATELILIVEDNPRNLKLLRDGFLGKPISVRELLSEMVRSRANPPSPRLG